MGSNEIVQKVLINLETKKAQEEMKKLAKESGNTREGLKALDDRAKQLEKTLHGIKASTKGVGDLFIAFNQTAELVGKGIAFAKDGLDAYAKTSRDAARDVNRLTSEFAAYKSMVMEGVGKAAVELGRAAVDFDQAMEALRRGGEKGFGNAYGEITKQWNALGDTAIDTAKAFKSSGEALLNTLGFVGERVASNAQKAMENSVANARKMAEEYRKIGRALLGPGVRAESHRAGMTVEEEQDIQMANARYRVEQDEALTASRDVNWGAAKESLSASSQALVQAQEAVANLQRDRQQSLLEAAFGPIEQVDLYKQAFESLGGVFQSFSAAAAAGYESIVSGSGSASAAIKKVFADSMMTLGKSSLVEGLKQAALGVGALAAYNYPEAALHFKSAALHGAVALAAGVAANAAGVGSSGGASVGGPSGSSSSARSVGNYGGGPTPGGDRIIVVQGDSFSEDSPRMRQLRAERIVNRAFGSSGVSNK